MATYSMLPLQNRKFNAFGHHHIELQRSLCSSILNVPLSYQWSILSEKIFPSKSNYSEYFWTNEITQTALCSPNTNNREAGFFFNKLIEEILIHACQK